MIAAIIMMVLGAFGAAAQETSSAEVVEVLDETTMRFGDPASAADVDGPVAFGAWDLVRMVAILAGVVAAIYAVLSLIRRTRDGAAQLPVGLRIVGTQTLPGNRAMHLVEVGNQVFLVGSTDHSVQLISEITDQETKDELRIRADAVESEPRRPFADFVSVVFRPSEPAAEPVTFLRRQRERVRKL